MVCLGVTKYMNHKQAAEIAERAHFGQVRKYSGEPYHVHPHAVARACQYENAKIVAELHDVPEDTSITIGDLVNLGLSPVLAYSLDCVTHRDGEDYLDYIKRAGYDKIAREVKMRDLEDNMRDLKDGCQKSKYVLALYILKERIW